MTRRIAVEPKSGRFASLEDAVTQGGAVVAPLAEAEALVWADPARPEELPAALAAAPSLEWVGLPFAGIEPYVPYLDRARIWTCAKGVYARPVAEHALMLGLAGLRGMATYARASHWEEPEGHNLLDGKVVVFGGGGITTELLRLLGPFNCDVTVLRRQDDPFPGASRTISMAGPGATSRRLAALAEADLVVLALALTPETEGIIGLDELAAMPNHSWLVNVARGGHVVDEALMAALEEGSIGGAALDVTDPEPLPDSHPFWKTPRLFITPHVANTPEMGVPLLASHIVDNVSRFVGGQPLTGLIDIYRGY